MSQILALQAQGAAIAGDPIAVRAAAEEGRDLADAIGDRSNSRVCRFWLGLAQGVSGDLAGAVTQFGEVAAESEAAHDEIWRVASLGTWALYSHIRVRRMAPERRPRRPSKAGAELGGFFGMGYQVLALAALAAGDRASADEAREAASKHISVAGEMGAMWRYWGAEAALAGGDLAAARRLADDAVSTTKGWYLLFALTGRARVLMAQGEPKQAERDAHDALTHAAEIEAHICVPDILEVLADLAGEAGSHHEAARLFGAAQAIRQRIGRGPVQNL